jgi:riboflavin synthase
MKLPIIKIAMLLFGIILSVTVKAQIVTTNPLEYVALAEGNELILAKVRNQMDGQKKTALLQNTIAAEFEQMRQWEKKYNSYLKTASGFASSIKACTHLYNDGVRIFITLGKLKNAVSDNPQGIVASISMNNLYMETATEMVSVYTLLKNAIAEGGVRNMLTGAERSQTLWALNERLAAFQKKLRRLCLSIRYYTFNDVWASVTAGMIDRDNASIARQAKARWKRVAKSIHP